MVERQKADRGVWHCTIKLFRVLFSRGRELISFEYDNRKSNDEFVFLSDSAR